MLDLSALQQLVTLYSTPALIILGSIIVGYIFEKIILGQLSKIASRTTWRGDDIILEGVRGLTTAWFVLAGIYFAFISTKLLPPSALTITKSILLIIAVLTATIAVSRIAVLLVREYTAKGRGHIPGSSILINITNIIVFIIGGLVVLQTLGISITPILTALGVGGLAVALALQDTLSNLFSGLQIIVTRQIEIDDYIQLESGEKGYVTDITWRNTTIKMLSNNLVIVPNSKIAKALMTNFSKPQKEMSVLIDIGVSYGSDLEKVERVTIEVAKEVMERLEEEIGFIEEFEPFIRYHTFAAYSINFTVILRVTEFVNQYLLKHEFVKALHKRYQQEGILIPFPIQTLEGSVEVKK